MFGGALDNPYAALAMTLGPALMAYGFEQPGLAQIGPNMLAMNQRAKETAAETAREEAAALQEREQIARVVSMFGAPTAPASGIPSPGMMGPPGPDMGAAPGGPPATGGMFDVLTPEQRSIAQSMALAGDTTGALKYAGELVESPSSAAFEGTGLQAQAWNTLLDPTSDPNSPNYAAAYSIVSQPRLQQVPTASGGTEFAQFTPEIPPNIRRPGATGVTPQPASGMPQGAVPPAAPPVSQTPVSQGSGMTVRPVPGTATPRIYSEGQTKAAGFANRMQASGNILESLESQGFSPSAILEQRGSLPGVGNLLASPEFQQYEAAKQDFITAVLRRESGAVIGAAELVTEDRKYFPQLGDSPEVIAQKAAARARAIDSMIAGSQGAYESLYPQIEATEAPSGGTVFADMSLGDIVVIDPSTLSSEERQAMESRLAELGF
jgi:hypothetical protein